MPNKAQLMEEMMRRLLSGEEVVPEDFANLGRQMNSTGKDAGELFPASDAADFANGASHIPYEVTDARRAGEKVTFYHEGYLTSQWYWEFEDGKKIYHD